MSQLDNAIVLHNRMAKDSPEDILDVRVQAEWIAEELEAIGCRARMLPFTLDAIEELREAKSGGGCFVVNLVDAAPGEESFVYLAPSILEAVGIPYTGCGAQALAVTTDKVLTKRLLRSYNLPTPAWFEGDGAFEPGAYLVKPRCEDASIGLDDLSVVRADEADALRDLIGGRAKRDDKPYFAEKFVDGREFNVCVYGSRENPVVLPPYEWIFPGFAETGKPRIINYCAKWVENTFEYDHLAAVYHLPPEDASLLAELARLTGACWRRFGLNGYARVDFRIDGEGRPWILEVNCNPSFYGFFNIARAHGFPFAQVVRGVAEALNF